MRNEVIDKSMPAFLQNITQDDSEAYLIYCILAVILDKIIIENPLKPIELYITPETEDIFIDLGKRLGRTLPYFTKNHEFVVDVDTKEQDQEILTTYLDEIKEAVYVLDESNEYMQFVKNEMAKEWLQKNGYTGQSRKTEQIDELPSNWHWHNREKGQYSFAGKIFIQTGKLRKKVFQALMDTFEKTPQAVSMKTLKEKTGIDAPDLRTEVFQINTRLKEKGFEFEATGKGYYILNKIFLIPPLPL